jgi:hypothetical protein
VFPDYGALGSDLDPVYVDEDTLDPAHEERDLHDGEHEPGEGRGSDVPEPRVIKSLRALARSTTGAVLACSRPTVG